MAIVLAAAPVTAGELAAVSDLDVRGAEVAILGEVHDNPAHHRNQALALVALAPAAVVYEMLTPEQAATVNRAERSDAVALATALNWDKGGWPDFALYHPLFLATDALVYGAAIPREELSVAMRDSAAVAYGTGEPVFPLGPLPAGEQALREDLQREAHCNALPEEMLPGMVEAQRLRDARFSAVVLRALEETGGPVAVITGNGHARRDWGMPRYLLAARPGLALFSLGQFEESAEPAPPFDAWLITPAAEREDPCAVFSKS
ncbi:ChaN family lipoprotein [Tropicimonas sp.]|uniref:ChaN family lipoprotein n=1 Tax=Tropicimonas sp. TaxID=2067044 RepID=UPI003A8BE48B